MAALGVKAIRVSRQPVIGLLSTGSELLEAGQPLAPGKIYESNRVTLATLLRQAGAVPKVFPLVPDTLDATQAGLEDALAQCDAVITTGGVSVGEHDHVKKAFEQIGGVMEFWLADEQPPVCVPPQVRSPWMSLLPIVVFVLSVVGLVSVVRLILGLLA